MNYNKEQVKSQKTVNYNCHKIKSSIAPVKSEEEDMTKERCESNEGFKGMRNASTLHLVLQKWKSNMEIKLGIFF